MSQIFKLSLYPKPNKPNINGYYLSEDDILQGIQVCNNLINLRLLYVTVGYSNEPLRVIPIQDIIGIVLSIDSSDLNNTQIEFELIPISSKRTSYKFIHDWFLPNVNDFSCAWVSNTKLLNSDLEVDKIHDIFNIVLLPTIELEK